MPNETAVTPMRLGALPSLWAIDPDAFKQLQAAVVSGDLEALGEPEEPQAATRSVGGGGGAIAVIPIQGVIRPRLSFIARLLGLGTGVNTLRKMIREAVADSQVGSIVLDVDSPGGVVDGVPELAEEIRAARKSKPIVAVANTTAASAAYHLASQATELFVTPSGRVGSIGVFVAHEDWSKFDEALGVETTFVYAGKYKVDGNPLEPLTDTAREAFQNTVDGYYDMFVQAVAKGRGVAESKVRGGFGEGRMVMATDAKAEGMVDAVGTLEDAISRAADLSAGRRRSGPRAEEPGLHLPAAAAQVSPEEMQRAIDVAVSRALDAQRESAPAADEPGTPTHEVTPDRDVETELVATSPTFRALMTRGDT